MSIGAVPQFPQGQKRAVSRCLAAARRGLSAVPLQDCFMQQNITSLRAAMIKMHLQRSPWAVTNTQRDALRSPAPCCFRLLKPLGSRGFICGVFPLLPVPSSLWEHRSSSFPTGLAAVSQRGHLSTRGSDGTSPVLLSPRGDSGQDHPMRSAMWGHGCHWGARGAVLVAAPARCSRRSPRILAAHHVGSAWPR